MLWAAHRAQPFFNKPKKGKTEKLPCVKERTGKERKKSLFKSEREPIFKIAKLTRIANITLIFKRLVDGFFQKLFKFLLL